MITISNINLFHTNIGPCNQEYPNHLVGSVDKGYRGLANAIRAISPFKRPLS